jgi:hypothetical protein
VKTTINRTFHGSAEVVSVARIIGWIFNLRGPAFSLQVRELTSPVSITQTTVSDLQISIENGEGVIGVSSESNWFL